MTDRDLQALLALWPGDHIRLFLTDGEWAPPRAGGYAIELWVQAHLPSPSAFGQTALAGVIDRNPEGVP